MVSCATIEKPLPGSVASLIVGQLKLDVKGTGTAINGAHGTINAIYPYRAVLTITNVANGKTYDLETVAPIGLFTLANAEPGDYKILQFWCQVRTDNAWVTLITHFDKSPVFDVGERQIANLGVILWKFGYDLYHLSTATSSFIFGGGGADVMSTLARAYSGSPWLDCSAVSATVSGEVETASSVIPLNPMGGPPWVQ
jgi:hypothetical protein